MSAKKIQKNDASPYVFQGKKQDFNFNITDRIPWTEKQKTFLETMADKDCKVMFLSGPAGVSKTIISVFAALQSLKEKKVSELVYLRSVVESSSNKMGYLPGSLDEKLYPYLEPLVDKLDELVGPQATKILVEKKMVSARPINFLRGCQFTGKYIILDEAQCLNFAEMQTFMTRIGEFSKVIICGDPNQSDIGSKSAFKAVMNAFDTEYSKENGIMTFKFDKEDIVRSKILKHIVEILEKF